MSQNDMHDGHLPSEPAPSAARSPQDAPAEASFSRGKRRAVKTILLVLFILCFFTFPLGAWLMSIGVLATTDITENAWRCFLLLPIPLASLVLGAIYKKKGFRCKKNIVVGIIITVLLVLYGSFTFAFRGSYSHDYSYVDRISAEIRFDMPETGEILTYDWTGGTESGVQADTLAYRYISNLVFTDAEEIVRFNTAVAESDLWLDTVNTSLTGLLPPMCISLANSGQYGYFMIYNADLGLYNALPAVSGTYRYIFMAYSSFDGTMEIIEYSLAVQA